MTPAPVILQRREILGTRPGPHLLITGGVHGDEFEPMAAVRRLIAEFEQNPALAATLHGRLTLVPVVNEGAFVRGHRVAEDRLDLARTCPGRPDGSVTERTAHALSELIRSADAYIDLHTGGTELAVFPMTGYVLHPRPEVLATQRRMARAFNLPVIWGTSPELEGRSLSVARDAGVPAIYAEHHGAAACRAEGVEAYVAGCWNVMAELGLIARPQPASAVRHCVEDTRPQSGHMQVCNPSPITGCFTPAVALGDAVREGDLLGIVTDVLGTDHREIRAQQSGLVLVLRTFPRVRAGETVGVILETPKAS